MLLLLLVLSVVNGELEQVDFIDNSVMEEEDRCHPPLTEPPQVRRTYLHSVLLFFFAPIGVLIL